MAAQWFLESTRATGLAFRIAKLDRQTMRATLVGETGVPFERDISQEALDKFGYRIVRRDVEQQEQQA